ncbi:uncharacterized protein LOC110457319 [Mizuhopecten yessoensis]|uniref:uncharacterized protein LOC110457319 n=1 Tax=Mizuhopecten yessoensis TaxID=6573 RepID=UPI000B45D70C|nr:uncharacterized protein LOC110457319 [Mizuhopecten yessoensis]XP_021364209.1 uncharacterized protein LOC110457319 [Mizuhopecten yessoensis]XP_021364210.1 uncharacterized protein LOC110457319 [Mizuhopecten yessoensis]XP_021364211.1 uncharacterized protein LOC110457319 [Mizuhopecten yessoensis]
MESCSSTSTDSDSSTDDRGHLLLTPVKKRTYKSAIFHGISTKRARYHKVAPEKRGSSNISYENWKFVADADGKQTENSASLVLDEGTENDANLIHDERINSFSDTTDTDEAQEDLSYLSSSSSSSDSELESDNESLSTGQQENTWEAEQENTNPPLYEGCKHTKFSAYSMVMLFVTKRGLCREGFTELLEIIADLLPPSTSFTTSVYKVKDLLKTGINFQEHSTHYFCERCQGLLEDGNPCKNDLCQREESRTLEFCDLNFIEQLKQMFKDDNFLKLVTKEKDVDQQQNLNVVTAGSRYKEVIGARQISTADINITFTMNTDGVALFTSSKKGSLWPVYIAINELPVKLRFSRKYLIPCYLHCQVEKPNMLTYLTPLMKTLHLMQEKGNIFE